MAEKSVDRDFECGTDGKHCAPRGMFLVVGLYTTPNVHLEEQEPSESLEEAEALVEELSAAQPADSDGLHLSIYNDDSKVVGNYPEPDH